MRVVALDASLGAVSVAAGELGPDSEWHPAADFALRTAGHAETLMPMLARVMDAAPFKFADIERVVVTHGPGGFTGVRAGVAAARALALAIGCQLTGVSTLDALAAEARAKGVGETLAVAVDARRDMVFFELFVPGCVAAEPLFLPLDEAACRARAAGATLVGSGAPLLAARGAGPVRHTDLQPHARTFGPFAATRPASPAVRPLYLRPPDAKAQASFVLPRASP
jgi:tRNA threonylcarbamoyladenosine biosynthesis protein TsaB